jgi:Ni,Fe-hydrogenase III component G
MASAQSDANRGGDDAGPDGAAPRLGGVTPAQVARFILGLDGCLVSLDARREGEADVVVYTFAVASKEQSFVAPVRDRAVESIASVFPEAAAREAELRDRHGIQFEEPPAP